MKLPQQIFLNHAPSDGMLLDELPPASKTLKRLCPLNTSYPRVSRPNPGPNPRIPCFS